ncbi:MAG TPA: hypothetical protein VHI73_04790 [Solirubrobacteraceae bacterium]|nr:hypothetical protein [Solirubrobacteraceae bacterium]
MTAVRRLVRVVPRRCGGPVACVATALALGAAHAGAAAYPPPPGKVYAGVTGGVRVGDYTSFTGLVGRHLPVWQLFLSWSHSLRSRRYVQVRLVHASRLQIRLMLHLTTADRSGREAITPAGIASGAGDAYFLNLNRLLGAAGQVVYVRPFAEMNREDNVYSAYRPGGSRGASHSTASFRRAWRRMALILRGGDVGSIDRALAAQRMPPVHTSTARLPMPAVALVWCPQVTGDPSVAANSPRAYYPGSAYVDWLCTDLYSGFPNFSGLNRYYAGFAGTGKPFAFGEWGIHPGGDAPGFVARLFRWVRAHPRVRMVLFNQGNDPGGRLRLQRFPRSRAVLRSALRDPRFAAVP